MIKKLLLFNFAIVALLASCNKDGTTDPTKGFIPNTNSTLIVGKWTYLKDSINFYNNGKFVNKRIENYTDEYMQFNQDGTGKDSETTFTYKINGKTLSLNFAAYSIGGIQYQANQTTANILELSAHKLSLYYDFIAIGDNSVYSTLSK